MEDCLFCKIVAGTVPSKKIYEGAHTYAFLDINPVHLGHTLVVPKKHSQNIFSIDPSDWSAVMETVRKLAPKVKDVTGASGINIIMNNHPRLQNMPEGETMHVMAPIQLIDHVHIHIVPRFAKDGMKGLPQHKETNEALDEMAERMRNALN
jgi:histidine triad (HIT) family protein